MARVRKKAKFLFYILLFAVIAGVGIWVGKRAKPHFVKYPEFGIELPSNYAIHGIDVSKYQQFIDWGLVKEMEVDGVQISFAFIKATEGVRNIDRHFRRNWKKSRDAGLSRGAYHFFLPGKSGRMQAAHFISQVELEPGDLPPVIDIEQTFGVAPVKIRKQVKEFTDALEHYYKVKPIIYTNISFYNDYLKKEFEDYPLWIAHYLQKEKPRIEREWLFWQHSETGRVNGILSLVDFNVFNGDSLQFKTLLIPEAREVAR
ncbi:MAG: glycoside hydrolase family 25 protein [Chitinophagaceae bacterium]|nr:glycoside hydrolase family 25 protein [Chitinophagaceae bacterium]